LEDGYIHKGRPAAFRDTKGPGRDLSEGPKFSKKALYSELKRRCSALTDLVEQLEKAESRKVEG